MHGPHKNVTLHVVVCGIAMKTVAAPCSGFLGTRKKRPKCGPVSPPLAIEQVEPAAHHRKTGTMAKSVAPRKVIEMMKEATGASDDEVCLMLQLCDGDPNKATEALLSSGCTPSHRPCVLLAGAARDSRFDPLPLLLLQIPSSRWRARKTRGPR